MRFAFTTKQAAKHVIESITELQAYLALLEKYAQDPASFTEMQKSVMTKKITKNLRDLHNQQNAPIIGDPLRSRMEPIWIQADELLRKYPQVEGFFPNLFFHYFPRMIDEPENPNASPSEEADKA